MCQQKYPMHLSNLDPIIHAFHHILRPFCLHELISSKFPHQVLSNYYATTSLLDLPNLTSMETSLIMAGTLLILTTVSLSDNCLLFVSKRTSISANLCRHFQQICSKLPIHWPGLSHSSPSSKPTPLCVCAGSLPQQATAAPTKQAGTTGGAAPGDRSTPAINVIANPSALLTGQVPNTHVTHVPSARSTARSPADGVPRNPATG